MPVPFKKHIIPKENTMARTLQSKKILKKDVKSEQGYKLVYNKAYRAGKKIGFAQGFKAGEIEGRTQRRGKIEEVGFLDRVVTGMKNFLSGPN